MIGMKLQMLQWRNGRKINNIGPRREQYQEKKVESLRRCYQWYERQFITKAADERDLMMRDGRNKVIAKENE